MVSNIMDVINLGNSIIGVSILAMPYCFHKCGILLSLLLIIISGLLVRCACYLLLKSAVMSRRRNFAFLAFHAFGSSGKLAVEIGIIGFLIGVCIAFFVVIGDLGPPLLSQYLMTENTPNLRVFVLVLLGFFVALPLGMLRKVDSLTSLSALSIAFYGWLVLKIFSEASTQLISNEWWNEVNWWQPSGLLSCLPIFSMALSCQTQLFEFFDTLSEPSLKRMMSVVSGAVCMCSLVYIMVGAFGYIACHDKVITGNILVNLTPSVMTECIKFGFITTLAVSFPLCLFPCRTSLHSLLFKQGLGHHDLAANFIPDHRFRLLTISLVIVTIGVAIMIPNIEFVLGIIGSTIGTAICFIFPSVIFINDTSKNTTEKRMAQVVMCVGIFILLACTYSTLQEGTQTQREVGKLPVPRQPLVVELPSVKKAVSEASFVQDKPDLMNVDKKKLVTGNKDGAKELHNKNGEDEKRQEPPIPHESDSKIEKANPHGDLDPQAIQKEDKEIQKEKQNRMTSASISDISLKEKQELLLRKLEEQHKEQEIIIEQQKKVLEELKLHRERHDEARDKIAKEAERKDTGSDDQKKEGSLDAEKVKDVLPPAQEEKVKVDEHRGGAVARKDNTNLLRENDFDSVKAKRNSFKKQEVGYESQKDKAVLVEASSMAYQNAGNINKEIRRDENIVNLKQVRGGQSVENLIQNNFQESPKESEAGLKEIKQLPPNKIDNITANTKYKKESKLDALLQNSKSDNSNKFVIPGNARDGEYHHGINIAKEDVNKTFQIRVEDAAKVNIPELKPREDSLPVNNFIKKHKNVDKKFPSNVLPMSSVPPPLPQQANNRVTGSPSRNVFPLEQQQGNGSIAANQAGLDENKKHEMR